MKKSPLMHIGISYDTVLLLQCTFQWQYTAGAGAGARAEIIDKGGAGAENNNFGPATLVNVHSWAPLTENLAGEKSLTQIQRSLMDKC